MIPESTIDAIRQRTNLVELIGRFVPLKKVGAEFTGCCLFHNEKSPSFKVNEERAHCFGCGWHGDAIRFLQSHKGITFPEAVKELAGPLGIHVEENARPKKLDPSAFEYRDPEHEPEFKPKKRPRDDDEAPFDWQPCIDALTPAEIEKLAAWRGISAEFLTRMHSERLIGLYHGKPAIAVHGDNGAVVRCHYRREDGGWMYEPRGGDTAALVIGDPTSAEFTLAFESQWDAFAVLDSLGYHEDPAAFAAIVTRGATSNTDFSAFDLPAVIAIPQNDPEAKRNKKTGRTPAEEWLERIRATRHANTRVLVGRVPEKFKDANDWIRDGKPEPKMVRRRLVEAARSPLMATAKTLDELAGRAGKNDPDALIGHERRWLGRGTSMIFTGPSGIGKSTLITSMAAHWAAGAPWHGIKPKRALKVLVIQAENDEGDLTEMGAAALETLAGYFAPAEIENAKSNLTFIHQAELTGERFAIWLEEIVRESGCDVVFIDPLLSYAGGDISKQEVASQFFRGACQPILRKTGVVMIFVHHTGKTSSDTRSRANWVQSDFQYIGMGSSELSNWPRATACILPVPPHKGVFRFMLTKRGNRAGMTSKFSSLPVDEIFLAHSAVGLGWCEVEKPEAEPAKSGGRKRTLTDDDVLKAIGHPSAMVAKDRLVAELMSTFSVSDRTVRNILNNLSQKGLIEIAKSEPRPGGGPPVHYLRCLPS